VAPDGEVFVLGDNLPRPSIPSVPHVPLAGVQAIARQVWFSSRRGEGVPWGRIGALLESIRFGGCCLVRRP
jgi:hypothetical protein